MTRKKVGLGLVGCGGRLRAVMKLLREVTDDVEIVALCDPSPESIDIAREMFNPEARVIEDHHALARDPRVDWVMVGSWNCFHAEHTIAAFDAGKHVFCEKPMATTFEDCLAMRDTWKRSGKTFALGLTLRYSPYYRKIHDLIAEGRIGKVISMEFNETLYFGHGALIHAGWRRHTRNAGPHMLEKCCHDMDLVNWMIGSVPMRVASFGGRDFFLPENAGCVEAFTQGYESPDAWGKTRAKWFDGLQRKQPFTDDQDIVDNQVAIFEYASGTRVTFHTNCSAALPERRMYICGTEGTLRADTRREELDVCRTHLRNGAPGIEDVEHHFDEFKNDAHGHAGGDRVLAKELADTIVSGAPPAADLDDGFLSAVPIFGADASVRTGKLVDLQPCWDKAGITVDRA